MRPSTGQASNVCCMTALLTHSMRRAAAGHDPGTRRSVSRLGRTRRSPRASRLAPASRSPRRRLRSPADCSQTLAGRPASGPSPSQCGWPRSAGQYPCRSATQFRREDSSTSPRCYWPEAVALQFNDICIAEMIISSRTLLRRAEMAGYVRAGDGAHRPQDGPSTAARDVGLIPAHRCQPCPERRILRRKDCPGEAASQLLRPAGHLGSRKAIDVASARSSGPRASFAVNDTIMR